tara:strand:+ start:15888 stop:16133 length:246 start_codon:yes stop_codon:yes gene_type:complete
MSDEIKKAMKVLTDAMQDTSLGSYAHSWHCNIAMSVHDELNSKPWVSLSDEEIKERHKIANDAASRFMKLCFGVNTVNEYQ